METTGTSEGLEPGGVGAPAPGALPLHAIGGNPFRRALDLQRELVCEWSPGGTILFCNRAYREYFGYDEQIIGRNVDELIDWEPGNGREPTMERLLEVETFVNVREYHDGRAVEWTNTLVRADDGDPISVLAVGRDITERLALEAELRREIAALRAEIARLRPS